MGIGYVASFLLALCLTQVLAEEVKPVFVEDAIASQEDVSLRIVSGWQAEPGQFPWQFNLRMVNFQGSVSSCGGSVVHREWGISAAHCTASRTTLVIRAGVTSLTTPVYIFETNTWYNYPTYNDDLPGLVQPDDIAIIKFGRQLSFNELLRPIKIQSSADAFRNYNEQQLIASGFGATWTGGSATEVLNWVYLRGVSNPDCFNVFGSIITPNAICARFFNVTSQSTCSGDSGGPLMIVENNEPILIGVASFVAGAQSGGCHSGFPGGFIRPGPFHSWYTEITGLDFENLEQSEEEESSESSGSSSSSSSSESSETKEVDTTSPPKDSSEVDESSEKDITEEENDSGNHVKGKCGCKIAVDVKVRVGK